MSNKLRDRFIGLISTAFVGLLAFLLSSYVGHFETVQASDFKINELREERSKEYAKLNSKVSDIICYLDKSKCLE